MDMHVKFNMVWGMINTSGTRFFGEEKNNNSSKYNRFLYDEVGRRSLIISQNAEVVKRTLINSYVDLILMGQCTFINVCR